MNWDQIEGRWKEIVGTVREKWAKITDDEWKLIAGKKDRLLGKIQAHYGKQKDVAEKDLDEFIETIKPKQENQKTKWKRVYVIVAAVIDRARAAFNWNIAYLATQSGLGLYAQWGFRSSFDCRTRIDAFGAALKQ